MEHILKHPRVLAVAPTARGFGFAVFEGSLSPVDWGTKDARADKNLQTLLKVAALLDRYMPEAVVLEDFRSPRARRSKRIQLALRGIARLAENRGMALHWYSRAEVRQCFAQFGAVYKHAIARVIAAHVPEFEPKLPPVRKSWMSEDARMSIFDAASLAFTFFFDPQAGAEQ